MTKSEAAFRMSCAKFYEQVPRPYFWTFTFVKVMPDWYYCGTWNRFMGELQNLYGGTICGLKVAELHDTHGIHFHCLLNKRIWVGEVRRTAARYGIGRIEVVMADQWSVDYLSKYLSKQSSMIGVHKWRTVGGFRGTRVRDVEVLSELTRELKRRHPTGRIPYKSYLDVKNSLR